MGRFPSVVDPATIANPYPLYHRLRAEDPVYWDHELELQSKLSQQILRGASRERGAFG